MPENDGLQRLLEFLEFLDSRSLDYKLDHYSPDSITVTFSLVGYRVEADFEPDGFHYSVFKGDEAVDTNFDSMMSLIKERTK